MSEKEEAQVLHSSNRPWTDKELMKELYVERGLKQQAIADKLGCSKSTVLRWLADHGLGDGDPRNDRAYESEEIMRILYVEKEFSAAKISRMIGCANATVHKWLEKHGIERRSHSEARELTTKYPNAANYYTDDRGYECWKHNDIYVPVHRLQMVAEHGPDAVRGKHVHHKNRIPFDNRWENLELLEPEKHNEQHKKIAGDQRRELADKYENTDASSYELAEEYGVANTTVLTIHSEYYDN